MQPPIEQAAERHIRDKSAETLRDLYQALVAGKLMVPLFADVTTDASGRACARSMPASPNRGGMLARVYFVDRLLEWKKAGSKYAEITGLDVFKMAVGMAEVDCIYVNYSECSPGLPEVR